jgi:hypothetical protein
MRVNTHDPILLNGVTVREGDKLLCIQDFPYSGLYHIKGKFYEVAFIAPLVVEIYDNFYPSSHTQYSHTDFNSSTDRRLCDYFISIKQLRKEKLNKINEL